MITFFIAGQKSFGNRGCEALTRGTSRMLKDHFGNVRIIVPSEHIGLDKKQWPEHADFGVEFIQAHDPFYAKFWKIFQALPLPFVKSAGWPFPFPGHITEAIKGADALLAIGGDNYSLDYFSLPSALMEHDRIAVRAGKPVLLWGASLGPFKVQQGFIDAMVNHLKSFTALTIRETLSEKYAKSLGLENVHLVADSAFLLEDRPCDMSEFAPEPGEKGLVGFNVSPLVAKSRFRKSDDSDFSGEMVKFLEGILDKGYSVLLIPHVIPLNGSPRNNDALFMQNTILPALEKYGNRVRMAPARFNAAQLKHAISKCDYFIGARTHSTIGALSKCVPTVSISYSQKARGLNLDLFGHTDYTIASAGITSAALMEKFEMIVRDAPAIRERLAALIPEWKERARQAAIILEEVMKK